MVAEFISKASTIEKALEMRTQQYKRSFSFTSYGDIQVLGTADLRETIRVITQEELRKLYLSAQPPVNSIADVVSQEIQ